MHRFETILRDSDGLDESPAAVVVHSTLAENIARMQGFADAHEAYLRPHVKTHKSTDIAAMQVTAGAHGITAGTLGEAEVFADGGFDDIFIAYPLWASGSKRERLRSLARRTSLSIGIDSAAAVDALASALGVRTADVALVVEVECGARRSGVDPRDAGALARYATNLGFDVSGVFTYPGHGGVPGQRERAAADQGTALTAAAQSFRAAGLKARVVSAGSTPTAAFSVEPVITELRPGEYVFNDGDNLRLGACTESQIALFVASTVVSVAAPDRAIVDTGSKALGREGDSERGFGTLAGRSLRLRALNEYHGYLTVPEDDRGVAVGDRVAVIPNHVCPVVNSFDELTLVDDDGAVTAWPVSARGRLN